MNDKISKRKRLKKIFLKIREILLFIGMRYTSYAFASVSIAYAFMLFLFPSLYFSNAAYGILYADTGKTGLYTLVILFLVVGSIQFLATTLDYFRARLYSFYALLTLWIFVGITFFVQWIQFGVVNAGWLLILGICVFACNVLVSGWVDKCKIKGI